ncbi:MAG: CoA transferase [Deltaproteobacteria bacterium]|nr:CoA transferase [Deltaproteobacteria bacterium]
MDDQILSDIKVIDLTWYIAGAYCTKTFADYGAEVIKVEQPGQGDLADPKGKEVFKLLIEKADVFIENNSAKAMDHLELGPEVLLKVNPGLVCINMPSYGRTGPYSNYVGWGDNAEALTGHGWVRGYDDDSHPISSNPVFHMDSTGAGRDSGLKAAKKDR